MKIRSDGAIEMLKQMKADCSKCSGLCCIALFFSKADGFPENKNAGTPCRNLSEDFRCNIHTQLEAKKMKGCIGYDCFGAGQHLTQLIYQGRNWRDSPRHSAEIFEAFVVIFQLYQMRYYLADAMTILSEKAQDIDIQLLLDENTQLCRSAPAELMSLDLEKYRSKVNIVLKQACRIIQHHMHSDNNGCPSDFLGKNFKNRDMSGLDLSTKLLIAAHFDGCLFEGTIFLGADTRDADLCNADLRNAVFLTQGQINSAKGNRNTKLPKHLDYPVTWRK